MVVISVFSSGPGRPCRSTPGQLMSWTSVSRFSIDEGRSWTVHNFTSTSVFVDGLLSEPGDETLVMT